MRAALVALAALLLMGVRLWPAIFVGAFLVNETTAGSLVTSLSIASGNTLEAVVGSYLVTRFAHGRKCFDQVGGIFKFAALAGLCSTTVSATIGVTSLSLAGFAPWAGYSSIWFTWWLGDATGVLVIAPDDSIRYAHMSEDASDNPPVEEVLAAVSAIRPHA